MLYRLEIENFYSIRDPQVIDLAIAPNVTDPSHRFGEVYPGSEIKAPKVVALYGANASGKTTVLRALEFLAFFARDSAQRTVPGFNCERFNDEESGSRPIRLAAEFGGVMDLTPEVLERAQKDEPVEYGLYRYELVLTVENGAAQKVQLEALRQKPHGKGKWQRVFERDEHGKVHGSKSFAITGFRHLEATLRPNVSVLSSFSFFQHPAATALVQTLQGIVSTNPESDRRCRRRRRFGAEPASGVDAQSRPKAD